MSSTRPRILVVDDESLNRRLIQALLGPEGYEIITCDSGERALQIVANDDVDLVLLDVMMPGLDGIEVCRRIREQLDNRLLPVVIVSALADPVSRTRGKQAGADDFLTKPIHEDELLARVRNLLLLRHYHRLNDAQRRRAECDARRWKLASEVATAVASCVDYRTLTETLFERLRAALGIETAAIFERSGDTFELLATAGAPLAGPGQSFTSDTLRESSTCPHLEMLSLMSGLDEVGLFCVGRLSPFDSEDELLFQELSVHVSNAVAHVRSHLAAVSRLMRARSERENAETALLASEERHRILFDASPLPIWVFDPKTLAISGVNDALCRVLGYSREELLRMRVPDLKPRADIPQLVKGMAIAIDGRTHHVGVLTYIRKDRQLIELDITSHATTIGGELVMVAVGVDVTESRRLEDRLRQSQKMDAVGQLAGGVAHDFNNILAAILSNAEMARENLGNTHPNAEDLREIERAAQRAAVLTRQLLTFSRQEKREVRVLAVNEVVSNIEKMLARLVPEDIVMSTALAPSTGSVEADAGHVEQVLVNLVVNARDAMPAGGHLVIETSSQDVDEPHASQLGVSPGQFVVLSVSDTGSGMDRATQARIFEPFFTTKPVGKGTGLGLATVFGIVKQSQGAISVYSEPGRGSTFRVYLPRVDLPAVGLTVPKERARAGSGVVLVVEDDVVLRSVIRRQLASWGYSMLEAPNGTIALDLLESRKEPIDLLLTDLVMPGIDGRALARKVVAIRPAIKVLFMSGYTEHVAVKTAAHESDVHFIEKPFTGTTLSSAIQRALGT